MKVSVSMVTFNHQRYIARAIESVMMQVFDGDLELIIGEDCSGDRTRAIAEELAARHPGRIRLLPSDRRHGIMPNWLRTLAECRGEFLAVLDGDDWWTSPRKLALQIAQLESDPGLEMSGHVCRDVYDDGSPTPHDPTGRRFPPRYGLSDVIRRPVAISSAMLCRRRVLDALPEWFVEVPCGDWALQILCALRGDVGFIDEVMSVHNTHAAGCYTGSPPARQRRMLVETRRRFVPLLPPELVPLAQELEVHDTLREGREHERAGDYREAIRCYARCRSELVGAGRPARRRAAGRMLRARIKALLAGRHEPGVRGSARDPARAASRPAS